MPIRLVSRVLPVKERRVLGVNFTVFYIFLQGGGYFEKLAKPEKKGRGSPLGQMSNSVDSGQVCRWVEGSSKL